MKKDIHPNNEITMIKCACGAAYRVRSTVPDQKLEICGACHPFYTGNQKLIDTAGRVEKFNKRYAKFEKTAEKAETAAS